MRRIAISDIHGCLKTLRRLCRYHLALEPEDELYLLGDYIDRGPNPKGVIDYILELQQDGYLVKCLKGNHEDMLLKAQTDRQEFRNFMSNGGLTTLLSFKADHPSVIPTPYIEFMENLETWFEVDNYLLVHAGFDCRSSDPLKDEIAHLWIRQWETYLDQDWLGDRTVIHGHTPIFQHEIEKAVVNRSQIINIDNGCFVNYRPGKGNLCAFDMTNHKLYFQKNLDMPK